MKSYARAQRIQMRGLFLTVAIVLGGAAMPAHAQDVFVCDETIELTRIVPPKAQNIRHYANGDVLLAVVDDGRSDVGRALSVLILSPPFNDHGERQCRSVRVQDSAGYAAVLLDKAQAVYDPARGLTVQFPAVVHPTSTSLGEKVDVSVTINQATGMITPIQIPDPK